MALNLEERVHHLLILRLLRSWSESGWCTHKIPRKIVFLAEVLRQRAYTERLRRVMSSVYDREIVLFSVNRGPMRSFSHDESIHAYRACLR